MKAPTKRNPAALAMRLRASKAGRHGDRKKRNSKRACRKKVRLTSASEEVTP